MLETLFRLLVVREVACAVAFWPERVGQLQRLVEGYCARQSKGVLSSDARQWLYVALCCRRYVMLAVCDASSQSC